LSGSLVRLLGNRNVILVLALSLGLFWGQGVEGTTMLVIPALAFVMTLSTIGVDGSLFQTPSRWLKPAGIGIFMNYVVLGGLIIILSRFLPLNDSFRTGYIILAAVPPAVGVIPFTSILDGDVEFTLIGCIVCYFAAFLVIPLMFSTFLGLSLDVQSGLFTTLTQVVLIPLILSRVLRYIKVVKYIEPVRGILTNWSFFLIIYTVIAVNREALTSDPLSLLPAIALTLTTSYLLGYIIERIGHMYGIDRKKITSLVLMSTSKNAGFGAGLALSLFGKQTAIPITVQTVVMLSYIIFLNLRKTTIVSNQKLNI